MTLLRRFLWLAVLVCAVSASQAFCEGLRRVQPIDQDWRFVRQDLPGAATEQIDDGDWQKISLPHTFNAVDGTGHAYYRGAAWYRRTLNLPKQIASERTFIEFDGVALASEIWVNGQLAGRHEGGFARFRFDITSYLKTGDNTLAVRVDNSKRSGVAPLGGDYTVFGGIYRSVRLVTTKDVHIDMLDYGAPGIYFKASQVTEASSALNWIVRLANDRQNPAKVRVVVRLVDARHNVVQSVTRSVSVPSQSVMPVSLDMTLARPHLWQGVRDPYLYETKVDIVSDDGKSQGLDQVSIPVGIRDIRFDADHGLLLNGKPYSVHGVNIHPTMLPGKGSAVSDADIETDYRILGDLGVTGLRFAHYQHALHEYDLADRAGYLIWTEVPLVSEVNGSDAFAANAAQQLRELIRQNYNHPSVIVWGLGNEIYKVDAVSAKLLDAMQGLAHEEDTTRPTVYANCCGEIDGPQASHTDLIGSNVYFGWYTGEFSDLGPWLDNNRTRIPLKPMAISEYGAGGSVLQQEDPPQRPVPGSRWHPEQYQSLYHEAAWNQIKTKPYLWGSFIWAGFDFPSAGRNEGDHAGINDKGLVTYDRRIRKDAYYWYQANWSLKPMVYITSKRQLIRDSSEVEVKVYSNLSWLVLRLNGVELARQPVNGRIAKWPVTLNSGHNKIEVRGPNGLSDNADWTYIKP